VSLVDAFRRTGKLDDDLQVGVILPDDGEPVDVRFGDLDHEAQMLIFAALRNIKGDS